MRFAVLGYAVTSMETETYRPSRLILLGEDASPRLRRSTSLDALVTPQSPPFFVWHIAEDTSSPLYRVYQAQFRFSAATLTAVFAVYVLVLLATLRPRVAGPATFGP